MPELNEFNETNENRNENEETRENLHEEIHNMANFTQPILFRSIPGPCQDVDATIEMPAGLGRIMIEAKYVEEGRAPHALLNKGEIISGAHFAQDALRRGGYGLSILAVHNTQAPEPVELGQAIVDRVWLTIPAIYAHPDVSDIFRLDALKPDQRLGRTALDMWGAHITVAELVEDAYKVVAYIQEKHPGSPYRFLDPLKMSAAPLKPREPLSDEAED